jgi:hypothetical protein
MDERVVEADSPFSFLLKERGATCPHLIDY